MIEDCTTDVRCPVREWRGPEPWDYQRRLVESYLAGGPEVWRSPPGSGKTSAVLQLFAAFGRKTLVVAPKDAIFTQWVERAEQLFGFMPGIIKGSAWDERPDLVVASQRTLWKSLPAREYGLVVFDEAQLCASNTYPVVIDGMPAAYRLAVSGDEHRSDEKEFLVYDQFGKDVVEVTREELLDKGTLVDVEVVAVESEFEARWFSELSPEEQRLAEIDGVEEWSVLSQKKFMGRPRLLAEMAADPLRNALVVELAQECIRESGQVAILSRTRDHCLRLEAELEKWGMRTVRLMGEDRDFEFQRERFARREAVAAVGTFGKVGVGFESHRELARGVFASPVVANDLGKMQFDQFRGRFARAAPGKTRAVVYVVHDPLVFGDKPIRLLAKWATKVTVRKRDGESVPAASYLAGRRKRGHETGTDTTAGSKGQRGFWDD